MTPALFTDHDICLVREGTHFRLYDKLEAHRMTAGNREGVYFAV